MFMNIYTLFNVVLYWMRRLSKFYVEVTLNVYNHLQLLGSFKYMLTTFSFMWVYSRYVFFDLVIVLSIVISKKFVFLEILLSSTNALDNWLNGNMVPLMCLKNCYYFFLSMLLKLLFQLSKSFPLKFDYFEYY
jgi:hypothetical protein